MSKQNLEGRWPLAARLRYYARSRRIDRQIEALPEQYVDSIGKGEFRGVGREMLDLLVRYAGLRPEHRVLDVGCGLARVALHLQGYLGRHGTYEGTDVVKDMIEWDRQQVTAVDPRFRFHHADIANSMYNPDGKIAAGEFVFTFPDDDFDLALATSLFTHLQRQAAANYVAELARVVRPGGRAVTTWFLLNPVSREGIDAGKTHPAFAHELDGLRVDDPENPDAAVAFEEDWVREAFDSRGLRVADVLYGWWRGTGQGTSYQDVVIATK